MYMVICIIQKIDAHCHYVAVIIKQRRLFDLGEKNDEVLYWLVYICSVFDFQRSYITLCLTSLEPRIWMIYSIFKSFNDSHPFTSSPKLS